MRMKTCIQLCEFIVLIGCVFERRFGVCFLTWGCVRDVFRLGRICPSQDCYGLWGQDESPTSVAGS